MHVQTCLQRTISYWVTKYSACELQAASVWIPESEKYRMHPSLPAVSKGEKHASAQPARRG